MSNERRAGLIELENKVANIEKKLSDSWKEIAEQKTTIAVQGTQISQVLKATQKIEAGLWGSEGNGGLLGEIRQVKDALDTELKLVKSKQDNMNGWIKGLGVSILAAIGTSIGAFFKR